MGVKEYNQSWLDELLSILNILFLTLMFLM